MRVNTEIYTASHRSTVIIRVTFATSSKLLRYHRQIRTYNRSTYSIHSHTYRFRNRNNRYLPVPIRRCNHDPRIRPRACGFDGGIAGMCTLRNRVPLRTPCATEREHDRINLVLFIAEDDRRVRASQSDNHAMTTRVLEYVERGK